MSSSSDSHFSGSCRSPTTETAANGACPRRRSCGSRGARPRVRPRGSGRPTYNVVVESAAARGWDERARLPRPARLNETRARTLKRPSNSLHRGHRRRRRIAGVGFGAIWRNVPGHARGARRSRLRAPRARPPRLRPPAMLPSRRRALAPGARVGSRVSSPVVRLDGHGRVFLERRDGGVPGLRALARVQPPRLLRPGSFPGGTGWRRGDVRVRLRRRRRVRRRGPLRVLPAAGACLPTRRGASTDSRRCVLGRGSGDRPRRHRHRLLASECLARSSEDACAAHADGTCAWMDPSSDVDAAFCAPDVIRVAASEMFGARALRPSARRRANRVRRRDQPRRVRRRDAVRVERRRLAVRVGPHRNGPRVGEVDDARLSGKPSTEVGPRAHSVEARRASTSETTRWDACGDANQHPRTSSRRNTAATAATEADGWWRHDANDAADERGAVVLSFVAMFASRAAPALGLGGGDGECASLQPLFELYAGCAAAGTDAARCDETEACAMSPASGAVGSACVLDPSEAAERLSRRATRTRSRRSTARARWTGTRGKRARRHPRPRPRRETRSETRTRTRTRTTRTRRILRSGARGGYLVVTCAVAFFAVVAPFAAYANHLKGKGEDVCDRMPEWTREYVPRSLDPRSPLRLI